jgi:hypothetical protein
LGQIVLSRLSSGYMDRGKDLFQPDQLGIETHGEKVLLGVIGYRRNTPQGVDGDAHGVRAAASHKPTLLHHARNPEIYAPAIHGESSAWPGHPPGRRHYARPALVTR